MDFYKHSHNKCYGFLTFVLTCSHLTFLLNTMEIRRHILCRHFRLIYVDVSSYIHLEFSIQLPSFDL